MGQEKRTKVADMKYKVLLTTSGTGSRLGELTKNTNKALVLINEKATIDYILSSYSKDTEFVVTLGYLGKQVKDFLTKNYPDRHFEFITVDTYIGDGSSLLYSMRTAKSALQCPFIFHACDTIVVEPVPPPTENWIAGYIVDKNIPESEFKQYRTHKIVAGSLAKMLDKGVPGFDSIHIGMIGIQDYTQFWETLEEIYTADPMNQAFGDVPIIEKLLEKKTKVKWIPFKTWLDTGNIPALEKTEAYFVDQK